MKGETPRSDLEYLMKRRTASHDIEHMVTGLEPNHAGEIALLAANMRAFYRYFRPELASFFQRVSGYLKAKSLLKDILYYPESARVHMEAETASAVARGAIAKGDVLAVARVAGIQAAKRTPDLIPLCHPLLVGSVFINFEIGDSHIEVEAAVETVDRTGVEMEALTACAVAALTIYDMCKSMDKGMVIGDIALWEKTGGRSGTYRRTES